MPLFQTLHKEYLLTELGEDSIYSDTKGTLSERVDYAWKVYRSDQDKYTAAHKKGALKFLKETFGIPPSESKNEATTKLLYLMSLKSSSPDNNYIAQSDDIIYSIHITDDTIDESRNLVALYRQLLAQMEKNKLDVELYKQRQQPPLSDVEPSIDPNYKALLELHAISIKKLKINYLNSKKKLQFLSKIPDELNQLNQLILAYNTTPSKAIKIEKLREIDALQKKIIYKYPPSCMNNCPSYRNAFQLQLFNDLKKQYAQLGLPLPHEQVSMTGQVSFKSVNQISFANILANMSPNKAAELLFILSSGKNLDKMQLNNLYEAEDTEEAELFKTFMFTHSIEYIGGLNSKNFQITDANGNQYVLKVDDRLNQPRDAMDHLRTHSLKNTLTSIHTEREVTFNDLNNTDITRTLLITDFYNKGNLEYCSSRCGNEIARLQSGLHYYQQMANILYKIKSDGCAFPDMKNTNWLINDDDTLVIADSKSFLFADQRGMLDVDTNPANTFYIKITTRFLSPPELNQSQPCSIDKIHTYMFGKNLYQYLTQCPVDYLAKNPDGSQYNFDDPIFKSVKGQRLKQLIINTVKVDPTQRPTIEGVISELEVIESLTACNQLLQEIESRESSEEIEPRLRTSSILRAEMIKATNTQEVSEVHKKCAITMCDFYLSQFDQYKLIKNDMIMTDFIVSQLNEVCNATDLNTVIALKNKIQDILMRMKANPTLSDLQSRLLSLATYPKHRQDEMINITKRLAELSLEKRVQFGQSSSNPTVNQITADYKKLVSSMETKAIASSKDFRTSVVDIRSKQNQQPSPPQPSCAYRGSS